jgi:hypothetical protein
VISLIVPPRKRAAGLKTENGIRRRLIDEIDLGHVRSTPKAAIEAAK